LFSVFNSLEGNMIRDLFTQSSAWRYRRLTSSIFHSELKEFAAWLQAAHYTPKIIRHHLLRLESTLNQMPKTAPGVRHRNERLQAAFEKNHTSRSSLINYRGTQRAYQRFLLSQGRLEVTATEDRFASLCQRYRQHLVEVRGFARSTIQQHTSTVADFLSRGVRPRQRLNKLTSVDVDRFVAVKSAEMTRQSLQHTVAVLRSFLCYCHDQGEIPTRLDTIDTPRTYRGELLPRALEWTAVQALLRSIDRRGKAGERDYAILHLMAHYGLRPSEIVSLRLDSIDWRTRTLRVEQRKTRSALVLPLAEVTAKTLRRYIDRDRGQTACPHGELFLRARCPSGALKRAGVSVMFTRRASESGRDLSKYSAYSLRHGFAMRLLTRGVGVKAIGDVMGHRDLESTCVYLRLDIQSLRDVALDVPRLKRELGGRSA
jgi:integrase/recombinase XerD